MLDFRKTALFAALTLGVMRLYEILFPVRVMISEKPIHWLLLTPLIESLLVAAPLPVLMFLLYKNRITPVASYRMRWLACATAVVCGLSVALPRFIALCSVTIQSLPYLNSLGGTLWAARLWSWLRICIGPYALDGLILLSDFAFVFLLLHLTFATSSTNSDARQSRIVKRVALIATIMAGLVVASSLYSQIYLAVNYSPFASLGIPMQYGAETRWHFIFRNALSAIPLLCWLSAAWIIYTGVTLSPDKHVEQIASDGHAE